MSPLPNQCLAVLTAAALSSAAASASATVLSVVLTAQSGISAYRATAPAPASTTPATPPEGPRMTPVAPQHSAAAAHATQVLISFLTSLNSTAEITPERVGKQFGGTLIPDDDSLAYRSPDLGNGWIYGVKVIPPKKAFKPGFGFWFYNPDRSADPSTVCSLTMAALRQDLVAHGFVEKSTPSEIGGID